MDGLILTYCFLDRRIKRRLATKRGVDCIRVNHISFVHRDSVDVCGAVLFGDDSTLLVEVDLQADLHGDGTIECPMDMIRMIGFHYILPS